MRQHRPERRSAAAVAARLASVFCIAGAAACSSGTTSPGGSGLSTIHVSPDSVSLTTGGSETLIAHAQSSSGTDVSGPSFFWSSSDSLVASVNQSGIVTAHQPGAAQIGASAQGKSGIAVVIVVQALVHSVKVTPGSDTIYAAAPKNTVTLTAQAYDAGGKVLSGRPLFWTSNSGLVNVSSGGVVTATGSGAGTAV